jgi:hypothetical protein
MVPQDTHISSRHFTDLKINQMSNMMELHFIFKRKQCYISNSPLPKRKII